LSVAKGEVHFVSPQPGAQTLGPTLLEVSSTLPRIDRVEFSVDGRMVGVARTSPYRVVFDFGQSVAAHTVDAKVYANDFTRTEWARVETLALTSSINVDLVEVPFRGHFRSKLTPSQLELRENGVRQQVLELRSDRGDAHFIFVVDRSLSMAGQKLDAALRSVESFRARLRTGDSASLITFNHRVDAPLELTRSVASHPLVASGGTSLRDALLTIEPTERTHVIVISDGSDRNSLSSAEAVVRAASHRNVSLYAVLLGPGNATDLLQRLASSSGGIVLHSDADGLGSAMNEIWNEINGRYVAVYQSNAHRGGWRSIELSTRKGSVTRARKGYFAQ
jgi:uncharacterized protein YegL